MRRIRTTIFVLIAGFGVLFGQDTQVVFRVVVPSSTPKDASVFLCGNTPLLGNWNPGAISLTKENDSIWVRTFAVHRGENLEYKITLGTWNEQAVYQTGIIPGNSRLVVDADTEITIRPLMWSSGTATVGGGITGVVQYHRNLRGEGLRYARDLIVWVPPSYKGHPNRRYPVLYMHDGQNIIDPKTSFAGFDWRVDEVADSLIRAGRIEEIIIVGIYNSPDRMTEYSDSATGKTYANFVVHTVKPFIDSTYRTLPDRAHTAIMGSSLGGLMSFLFMWWRPDIFSMAGCLSSTFSYNKGKVLRDVEATENPPRGIRLYLDCGGFGGEASLKPGMDSMIQLLESKGYKRDTDFRSYFEPSADHSERAWAARVWRPLEFFFGK